MCGGCDLVKYCSDDCRENHREQHEEECKKRADELRDKKLFEQPDESCYGDCPICCLPLSLDIKKSTLAPCCCKSICNGCDYANKIREIKAGLEQRCAFCREPAPETDEEADKRLMVRIKKKCPAAMNRKLRLGEGNYESALEYIMKAAAFCHVLAHYNLSNMYREGISVEKDMKKSLYHAEQGSCRCEAIPRIYRG